MNMILFHICSALLSLIYTTYVFFEPATWKFYANYVIIGATVASGTYLEITRPVHIAQACTTGLLYIGFVSILMVAAHYRLARATVKK